MRRPWLILILLLLVCFSLVAWLQPRQAQRMEGREQSGNVLTLLLGDGRKMFANHFFVKADVYFHSGYYPSIFDQARQDEESESDVSHPEEGNAQHQEEKGFLGEPQDWIDRFSRHFRPVEHTHLQGDKIREILPWMKLSAELDPQRLQTYIVTAYWLRIRLGKSAEAEQFLRQGLSANPRSPELLFQLGQLYLEDHKDTVRAKNLFSAALRRWHEVEEPKPEKTETGEGQRNIFLLEQILGGLVHEEIAAGHPEHALEYLKVLKQNATDPAGVQKQMNELQDKMNEEAGKPPGLKQQ